MGVQIRWHDSFCRTSEFDCEWDSADFNQRQNDERIARPTNDALRSTHRILRSGTSVSDAVRLTAHLNPSADYTTDKC